MAEVLDLVLQDKDFAPLVVEQVAGLAQFRGRPHEHSLKDINLLAQVHDSLLASLNRLCTNGDCKARTEVHSSQDHFGGFSLNVRTSRFHDLCELVSRYFELIALHIKLALADEPASH